MSAFRFTAADVFPPGTLVGAYEGAEFGASVPSVPATETQTVDAAGYLNYVNLKAGAEYVAYSAGISRRIEFQVPINRGRVTTDGTSLFGPDGTQLSVGSSGANRGAWAAATAYAVGDRYADPNGLRRDVTAAYTSGATFAATDTANTAVAGASSSHAQPLHGRGGTDPLLNGLEISDQSSQQSAHTFQLSPRTTTTLTYPVPVLQPKTAGLVCALDVAPSSGAAINSNNGYAWADICDQPVMDAEPYNGTTLRIGNQGTFAEVSTRKFGTGGNHNSGSAIPLYLGANYPGNGNPQIYMSPMGSGSPAVILGYDGSSVFAGTNAAMSASATKGFFHIPCGAGPPTGTPVYTGQPAIYFDTTNSKLYAYNGGWKGVTFA